MAGGDEFLAGGTNGRNALSALLFLAASTNALDAYSALNSSPWTAESFGGDPEKEKAMFEYVYHAIGVTAFYGTVSAIIARNIWPIIGTVIADVYMYWLYSRAARRAKERGSKDWNG